MQRRYVTQGCSRCHALGVCDGKPVCMLGYKIDEKTAMPKEACPKPLLYIDFIELRNEMLAEKRREQ